VAWSFLKAGERLMHIADGVLSAPVLVGGGVLAVAGLAVGIRQLEDEQIPRVALLTAAFFVASIIHVPVGPSSAHLVMNGFMGLVLGWKAVPAIFIALILQSVLFRYGGITTLGVNTVIMAVPALVAVAVFGGWIRRANRRAVLLLAGFGAGVCGMLLGALLAATALALTGTEWRVVAGLFLVAHVPVMIVEGVITAALVHFIWKVKPEMLNPEPSV